MKASFNDVTATLSFLSRGSNVLGWSFLNLLLSEAARRAKIGTNRLETLDRPKKERSSVFVVGFSNFKTASVVRSTSSKGRAG